MTPGWLDSALFVALMSGPPKFRPRDLNASLAGEIDAVAAFQIGVWIIGGLWVVMRVYPSLLRRGKLPGINGLQIVGALLIVSLSLSLLDSPGVLLTGFTLGQFGVMLAFSWVFLHRYGTTTFLRHLFAGVIVMLLLIAVAVFVAPELVMGKNGIRVRGDTIAPTGALAAMGLVFCLSNVPRLSAKVFWLALVSLGVLLAAAQTRTAYISLLVYLAIGFTHGRNLRVRKLVPLLAAVGVLLVFLDVAARTMGFMVRETQSLQSMSDRLPLWGFLTQVVMERAPFTGLGYYAASRIVATEYNPVLGNAHSVVFEILVGGGVIAMAVYLLLCGALLWGVRLLLHSSTHKAEAVAVSGLLTVTLCQSLTGTDGVNAGPVGFTFWSLTALIPTMCRETVRARRGIRTFATSRLAASAPPLRRIERRPPLARAAR